MGAYGHGIIWEESTSHTKRGIMSTTEKPTAADLRLQLSNADEALAGLQSQIDGVQAEMTTHEQAITTLSQAAQERQGSMGLLQLKLTANEKDLKSLQATSVITRNTAAEQRTLDSMAALAASQAELEKQMQASIVADEDARGSDRQAEAEHDAAYAALQAQLAELQEHEQTLKQQREEIHARLGQAIFDEGRELLETLEDSLGRCDGQIIQYTQALLMAKLALKAELRPWYSLAQQAERELKLSQKPDDSTARILKALLTYLDALEQDGPYLPVSIDGRFLVHELALDGATLQALLKHGREPLDRANDFRHRRSQLGELLQKHNSSR